MGSDTRPAESLCFFACGSLISASSDAVGVLVLVVLEVSERGTVADVSCASAGCSPAADAVSDCDGTPTELLLRSGLLDGSCTVYDRVYYQRNS